MVQLLAQVHVCNVVVLDNPSHFKNPFQFEITFECIEVRSSKSTKRFYLWSLYQDLPEDLEWKIIYVGSAESEEYDQVIDQQLQFYDLVNLKALDTVYVGPVPEGRHMFVFQVFSTAADLVMSLAQVIYIVSDD